MSRSAREVHIKGYRSKNGGPFGYSVIVTLADGRTFQTGGAQDAPGCATAALHDAVRPIDAWRLA